MWQTLSAAADSVVSYNPLDDYAQDEYVTARVAGLNRDKNYRH